MSLFNLAFVMKTQGDEEWLIKGVWLSRVPLGKRKNQPPLLTMSGFITKKEIKKSFAITRSRYFFFFQNATF